MTNQTKNKHRRPCKFDLYKLLETYDQEQLCILLNEVVAEHFGQNSVDDFDFDLTGYLLEEKTND